MRGGSPGALGVLSAALLAALAASAVPGAAASQTVEGLLAVYEKALDAAYSLTASLEEAGCSELAQSALAVISEVNLTVELAINASGQGDVELASSLLLQAINNLSSVFSLASECPTLTAPWNPDPLQTAILRAQLRLERLEDALSALLNSTGASATTSVNLTEAELYLSQAGSLLEDALAALEAGNRSEAARLLGQAERLIGRASSLIHAAAGSLSSLRAVALNRSWRVLVLNMTKTLNRSLREIRERIRNRVASLNLALNISLTLNVSNVTAGRVHANWTGMGNRTGVPGNAAHGHNQTAHGVGRHGGAGRPPSAGGGGTDETSETSSQGREVSPGPTPSWGSGSDPSGDHAEGAPPEEPPSG